MVKQMVQRLSKGLGYEIKKWRPPTPTQVAEHDALQSVARYVRSIGQSLNVVFDVGANKGDYTAEVMALFPNARIFAFEPTPDVLVGLKSRYAGQQSVQVIDSAISDREGTLTFHVRPNSVWNSMLPNDTSKIAPSESKEIHVRSTTIAAAANEHQIEQVDLLKLDIQGAEMLALQGAAPLLSAAKIGFVQLELNFWKIYAGQAEFKTVSRFMFDHGYWLQGIYQASMTSGLLLSTDVVFAHNRYK
ncbi:MAG TPA: FkbM family methyltransferase [Tepidisphaeraceae bacterium]|jgi:FkbM family methyltransferase